MMIDEIFINQIWLYVSSALRLLGCFQGGQFHLIDSKVTHIHIFLLGLIPDYSLWGRSAVDSSPFLLVKFKWKIPKWSNFRGFNHQKNKFEILSYFIFGFQYVAKTVEGWLKIYPSYLV